MDRSIFDSFVSINETHGAISMVYAKRKYYLFVELLSLVENLWKKRIGLLFYDDFLSAVPLIKHCGYQSAIQNKIKFGVFGHESSKIDIREWMESTIAISSTWQVSATKLQQWYDDMEIYVQKSESNIDVFKLSMFDFNTASSLQSSNYRWARYKLSQLQISSSALSI